MSKLNEIKYDGLYIRRMNVPDSYVAYTYNDSMTVIENIYSLWNEIAEANKYLGSIVDLVNAMVEFLNGEGLKSHVTEKLEEWLEDGTLEELINESLFNTKADKVWVQEQLNLINEKINNNKLEVMKEVNYLKDLFTSIKEYGAVGDGVADDTQAFLNAMSDTTNTKIYIPEGTYNVTESIFIPSYKIIIGSGLTRNNKNASIIKYVGKKDNRLAVIVMGNAVGVEPINDATQINLEGLHIDANNLAGFGVYGTYITNESYIHNIGVSGSLEYGFYFAKSWFATYERLHAINNRNNGIAFGMPLTFSDGTKIIWSSYAPLEMNACIINNIRSHSNGNLWAVDSPNSFDPEQNYLSGYGIAIGIGNGIRLTNFQAESNGGVGLVCYTENQPSKIIGQGYLENNCKNSSLNGETKVNMFIENNGEEGGPIEFNDIYMSHSSGGILFKGSTKRILRMTNIQQPRFFKGVGAGLDRFLIATFVKKRNCYYGIGEYNIDKDYDPINTLFEFNTRHSFKENFIKPMGYTAIYARKLTDNSYGSINIGRTNGSIVNLPVNNLTKEYTLLNVIDGCEYLEKAGTTGSVDASIQVLTMNVDISTR